MPDVIVPEADITTRYRPTDSGLTRLWTIDLLRLRWRYVLQTSWERRSAGQHRRLSCH
jgi:hypothetical protein